MRSEAGPVKATVAILTKNPGGIFREVLDMVRRQNCPVSYEVLVIDSGSSDGTVEFAKQHPDVRLVQIPSSEFGHGKTRNLAISLAQGQYVAMLTHDAMPADENWLCNLIEPLEHDASVGGVFGRHLPYPTAKPWTKRDLQAHFDNFLNWPAIMGIDDPDRYAKDQGYRQLLHFFSDNNACLRKQVWERVPYPDVDFAEDQLWAKAMLEAGYKRAYADKAVVFHSHDYSIRDTFRRSYDESRALKRLFNYVLCPSLAHGCYQIYACSRRDLSHLRTSAGLRKSPRLIFLAPALNAARQLGFYIGAYQGHFSNLLFRFFSLDGANKRR